MYPSDLSNSGGVVGSQSWRRESLARETYLCLMEACLSLNRYLGIYRVGSFFNLQRISVVGTIAVEHNLQSRIDASPI